MGELQRLQEEAALEMQSLSTMHDERECLKADFKAIEDWNFEQENVRRQRAEGEEALRKLLEEQANVVSLVADQTERLGKLKEEESVVVTNEAIVKKSIVDKKQVVQ